MPRALTPDEFETWLQPDPENAAGLLAPSKAAFKFLEGRFGGGECAE